VARLHAAELAAISDMEQAHRRLVELNVTEQCINLFKLNVVQKSLKETAGKGSFSIPRIHGLVFDPADGYLRELPVGFKEHAKRIDEIYGLY
jgi:carbonic anhydrase